METMYDNTKKSRLTNTTKGNSDYYKPIIKITREEKAKFEEMKEKANIGCKFCPQCGKENRYLPTHRTWAEGFFKIKHYRKDFYICPYCGCEYESDIYQYR